MSAFLRDTVDGVVAQLRVTPKSSADQLAGLHAAADGSVSLQLKVRAQPEKGKANTAVIALMANWLGLPKSRLEIVAGHADRRKSLLIRGDADDIRQKISRLQGGMT